MQRPRVTSKGFAKPDSSFFHRRGGRREGKRLGIRHPKRGGQRESNVGSKASVREVEGGGDRQRQKEKQRPRGTQRPSPLTDRHRGD